MQLPLHAWTFAGRTQVPPAPVQVWHVPQAATQQRPSVQRLDRHSPAPLHVAPFAFLSDTQAPPSACVPESQHEVPAHPRPPQLSLVIWPPLQRRRVVPSQVVAVHWLQDVPLQPMPPQLCWLSVPLALQVIKLPLTQNVPVLMPHLPPLQTPVLHVPAVQTAHSVPQEAAVSMGLHVPLQSRKPWLQRKLHLVPSQVGVAFSFWGQTSQEAPQLVVLLLSLHSVPLLQKPARQANPQLVPSQVASAFAGGLHGVQVGPQKLVLVGATQLPSQSRWPVGQVQEVGETPAATHLPPQACMPMGHLLPHFVPSHVASPPSGAGQAVHRAPQLPISVFLRQASSQR
jgi:hypothetical protein